MSGEPELDPGISGEWVTYLQQLMGQGGFWQGPEDGEFTDDLKTAITTLQQQNGLMADGLVRADTWDLLTGMTTQATEQVTTQVPEQAGAGESQQAEPAASSGDFPELTPGISSEWVTYLQQLMTYYGFWPGPEDGEFSDHLKTAVISLQQQYGLAADGVVRAPTWAILTGTVTQSGTQQHTGAHANQMPAACGNAKACFSISGKTAWLKTASGAMAVNALGGRKGHPTPTGHFRVQFKDPHHKSTKYKDPHTGQPASMPHYVNFAPEVGFHAGSLSQESHGCVHLSATDAQTFYSHLNVGDDVSVIP
jgi:peptidoglycan hydrolase-like protein with peptidoglycan-binding domain